MRERETEKERERERSRNLQQMDFVFKFEKKDICEYFHFQYILSQERQQLYTTQPAILLENVLINIKICYLSTL